MLILGIESSCDETAAAILADGKKVLASVVNSQIDIHTIYGGVVPELASRQHIRNIYLVVDQALKKAGVSLGQVDGLAVTEGPGLVGCLLVGYTFAKSLSLAKRIPMVGVDHIKGHLLSVFLADEVPDFPYIATVISGGHSNIFYVTGHDELKLLGRTRDDAAGEAFDKVAKLLDLGYPGGPVVSRLARKGNATAIGFPRSWLENNSLDFSFSGLKTAVATYIKKNKDYDVADVCASFQESVVEVITTKTMLAARLHDCRNIVLGGGVAANPRLREALTEKGAAEGNNVYLVPKHLCTDNAAMIALAGYYRFQKEPGDICPETDVYSRVEFT